MKKITFFLTAAFLTAYQAAPASADSYKYTPYAGVDYTYNQTVAKGFRPYYNSLGLHIGSDYSRYFGTEMFINQSNGNKRHNGETSIKTSYRSYGLDLMAYLPLDCLNKYSLLATAGIGEYVYKTKFVPEKHHNEHGYGYRFGGGFKYMLTPNWGARIITRYVNFDHLSGYDHDIEYSAGIEYHF